MSESTRTIEELTSADYEYGFSTDLDTDIAPPGSMRALFASSPRRRMSPSGSSNGA